MDAFLAVELACLRYESGGWIEARDAAPEPREAARQRSRTGSEIEHLLAGLADTPPGYTGEEFGRKSRAMLCVVVGSAPEIHARDLD